MNYNTADRVKMHEVQINELKDKTREWLMAHGNEAYVAYVDATNDQHRAYIAFYQGKIDGDGLVTAVQNLIPAFEQWKATLQK